MEKYITKNGITITWDTENIDDMFATENVDYLLVFPNKQVYIGSARNLADRVISHCTHTNLKKYKLINAVFKKFKTVKVILLKKCQSYDEAFKIEKKIINRWSNQIYRELAPNNDSNFQTTVNKVLLNAELYPNSY